MRAVALLLVGCGRIAFDEPRLGGQDAADADQAVADTVVCATTNDEDGDAIDDSCDVCPHRADAAQSDMDGDRVGDACDPEPANPRQQLVFFDPFIGTTLHPSWLAAQNDERVVGGELVLDAIGTARFMRRPYTVARDWFIIGATTGAAGVGNHQITIVTAPITPPGGYYCEMYDDGGTGTSTMFTYTLDNTNYVHPGVEGWTSRLANGGGTFEYLFDGTDVRCRSAWRGEVRQAQGPPPAAITPDHLILYAENLAVRVEFFVQVRTNP